MGKPHFDTSGVTHGIILVCGGDGNLTNYVQENLDGIENYFRSLDHPTTPRPYKFAVLALADFLDRDAELHWYSPSDACKWKLGEINTGDPRVIGLFLAGALRALAKVAHVTVGFSGHGTGVVDDHDPNADGTASLSTEESERRAPTGLPVHSVGETSADAGGVIGIDVEATEEVIGLDIETREAAIGIDDRPVTDAAALDRLEKILRGGEGSEQPPGRTLHARKKTTVEDDKPVTDPAVFGRVEELLPIGEGAAQPPDSTFQTSSDAHGVDARRDWLTTVEVAEVLDVAREHIRPTAKVDLLFFDSCFNGMVEVAYQCRTFADVFIGSMNKEPKALWDYSEWLRWMEEAPPESADAWAGQALRAFEVAVLEARPQLPDKARLTRTLTAVKLERIDDVVRAFKTLVTSFSPERTSSERPPSWSVVLSALGKAQNYGNSSIRDVVDFACQLDNELAKLGGCEVSCQAVRDSCRELKRAVSQALVSPAPMIVVEPGHHTLDGRRVHGLSFWGPVDECSFRKDRSSYAGLEFEYETRWCDYLKPYLDLPC